MNVYAIVPARGGSKGIPRKNVKLFKGKPLIAHTIEQAKASAAFGKIIVSTDDKEIAQVAEQYGATVLMRPSGLAGDLSRDYEFMKHAAEQYTECDVWCQLRPTFPLRTAENIQQALEHFDPSYSSLRSVVQMDHSVYKTYFEANGVLFPVVQHPNIQESFNAPRQVLPKSYQHNGCIDITKKKTIFEEQSITGSRIQAFIMTANGDIDTMEQWKTAENT